MYDELLKISHHAAIFDMTRSFSCEAKKDKIITEGREDNPVQREACCGTEKTIAGDQIKYQICILERLVGALCRPGL